MKKISFVALISAVLAMNAFADFVEPVAQKTDVAVVGFVDGNETILTVEQVNDLRDDTIVIIEGNIVKSLGDEKYLFKDSTGSIKVEIDDEDWGGQAIRPEDVVKIYGEVDRGIFKVEIDVDKVVKK